MKTFFGAISKTFKSEQFSGDISTDIHSFKSLFFFMVNCQISRATNFMKAYKIGKFVLCRGSKSLQCLEL